MLGNNTTISRGHLDIACIVGTGALREALAGADAERNMAEQLARSSPLTATSELLGGELHLVASFF